MTRPCFSQRRRCLRARLSDVALAIACLAATVAVVAGNVAFLFESSVQPSAIAATVFAVLAIISAILSPPPIK